MRVSSPALLLMVRQVLGGPNDEGRARYQVARRSIPWSSFEEGSFELRPRAPISTENSTPVEPPQSLTLVHRFI